MCRSIRRLKKGIAVRCFVIWGISLIERAMRLSVTLKLASHGIPPPERCGRNRMPPAGNPQFSQKTNRDCATLRWYSIEVWLRRHCYVTIKVMTSIDGNHTPTGVLYRPETWVTPPECGTVSRTHHTVSNPDRCLRPNQAFASASPTICSVDGSHFKSRPSRMAMFDRWHVVSAR